MNKIICGQCEFSNHDRCIGKPCECGCPGFSMPLPPDERNPAGETVFNLPPGIDMSKYAATNFPTILLLNQDHRIITPGTQIPTDRSIGTIVAEYQLRRVYRRRQIVKTIEENLDIDKYVNSDGYVTKTDQQLDDEITAKFNAGIRPIDDRKDSV